MKLKRAIAAMVLVSAFAAPAAAGTFEDAVNAHARGERNAEARTRPEASCAANSSLKECALRPVPQLATGQRRGVSPLETLWHHRPHRQLTKILLVMVRLSLI
jgi:hypothetical protein